MTRATAARIASARSVATCVALAAVACSSAPPTHFHSLVALPASTGAAVKTVPPSGVRFEVLPVTVPVQVDLPQMVVRLADGTLAVLEHERWIAPLADEIRAAVTLRAEQVLADATAVAPERRWRVQLDVQRLDSLLGRSAAVQLQWSLHSAGATALRCQARDEQPVAAGAAALAAAHRALFERLGDVIGRAIKVAAAGGTPACQ